MAVRYKTNARSDEVWRVFYIALELRSILDDVLQRLRLITLSSDVIRVHDTHFVVGTLFLTSPK